jgi:hypothetical protein
MRGDEVTDRLEAYQQELVDASGRALVHHEFARDVADIAKEHMELHFEVVVELLHALGKRNLKLEEFE